MRRPAVSLAVAMGILAALSCADDDQVPRARLSVVEALGGADTAGYARAIEPRTFVFPADHGPHPEFRTEWWYFTGNLSDDEGRQVGYQLTVFRSALAPDPRRSPSAWATNQAYMGHFALTDVQSGDFHAHERFARGGGGLAGAEAWPFRVWVGPWEVASRAAGSTFPLRLRASEGDVSLRLEVDAGKPMVLQGDSGLSRKSEEPGNASYYYSFTRMPSRGTVVLGADTLSVSGLSWLDREWSTSVLGPDQVGWDWFALQLSDGWELMVYTLRRADGTAGPLSQGVLVDPDGGTRRLAVGADIDVAVTDTWTSHIDGATYPSGWRLSMDGGTSLTVTPLVDHQELDLAFRYWEGAVRVKGSLQGRPVTGRGYVELTGYAGQPLQR